MSAPEALPWAMRLRLELARWNGLSAMKRLTCVLSEQGNDLTLAEAQHFYALSLALVEQVQADLPFWRIKQRLLAGVAS